MMEVEVMSNHVVYPAKNSNVPQKLILSNNDQIMPKVHVRMMYFFEPSSSSGDEEFMSSQVLRESLAKTLAVFWPVVGKLKERPSGGLDIEFGDEGEGAEFVDVGFTGSFEEELGDHQPKAALNCLLPVKSSSINETPMMKVQVSRFKCGRVCLAVAMHHVVCDGRGMTDFIKAWANNAAGKGMSATPYLDRSVLKARHPPQTSFEHVELSTRPHRVSSNIPALTAKLFEFTADHIQILKEEANRGREDKSFTAFEALAAHMWKCLTKAREIVESKQVKLGFAMDGRERFVPPLPANYFGNVNFFGLAQSTAGDLVSKPLSHTVTCIHEAKLRVNDEYMRSVIDWVELQPSPVNIVPGFDFFCSSDIALTSWSKFPGYDTDFGWGKPTFYGIPTVAGDGLVVFLPSKHGPNSVNVVVGLIEQHMQNLLNNLAFSSIMLT